MNLMIKKSHWYIKILVLLSTLFIPIFFAQCGKIAKAAEYQAYVLDQGNLFSDTEEQDLTRFANALVEAHNLDVALITLPELPSPADEDDDALRNFTATLYETTGLNEKGVLMLVAYDGGSLRRTWFYPGEGIVDAFTASGQEYMWQTVKPYFSDLEFYNGYKEFLTRADDFLLQYENGTPYSKANKNIPVSPKNYLICAAGAIVTGLILAFCVVYLGYYKGQLKSVRADNRAANYMRQGSRNVTNAKDIFLYITMNRTKKPDNNSSSSSDSGSGGSGGSF